MVDPGGSAAYVLFSNLAFVTKLIDPERNSKNEMNGKVLIQKGSFLPLKLFHSCHFFYEVFIYKSKLFFQSFLFRKEVYLV